LSAPAKLVDAAQLKSDRPYRKGMPPDAVAQVLRDMSGAALCPPMVEAALDVLQTPAAPSARSLPRLT